MKTKNLKERRWLLFEEYLGFDPLTDNLPENWFAPVTVFFAYRKIVRGEQIELPLQIGAKA